MEGVHYTERPGAYGFLRDSRDRLAVIQTTFGYFLPGGGLEPGEDSVTGLKREILEEISYEILSAHLVTQAAQYHWSEFYQKHFRKVGSFFVVEYRAPARPVFENEHTLHWLDTGAVARKLSQEFQRWALAEYLK